MKLVRAVQELVAAVAVFVAVRGRDGGGESQQLDHEAVLLLLIELAQTAQLRRVCGLEVEAQPGELGDGLGLDRLVGLEGVVHQQLQLLGLDGLELALVAPLDRLLLAGQQRGLALLQLGQQPALPLGREQRAALQFGQQLGRGGRGGRGLGRGQAQQVGGRQVGLHLLAPPQQHALGRGQLLAIQEVALGELADGQLLPALARLAEAEALGQREDLLRGRPRGPRQLAGPGRGQGQGEGRELAGQEAVQLGHGEAGEQPRELSLDEGRELGLLFGRQLLPGGQGGLSLPEGRVALDLEGGVGQDQAALLGRLQRAVHAQQEELLGQAAALLLGQTAGRLLLAELLAEQRGQSGRPLAGQLETAAEGRLVDGQLGARGLEFLQQQAERVASPLLAPAQLRGRLATMA